MVTNLPVWPNAANNAFKRASYGLIDYYIEEEKELRYLGQKYNIDDKIIETKIDTMWGKVTLYNAYQMFVQLTSKKMQNPTIILQNEAKAGKYDEGGECPMSSEEFEQLKAKVEKEAELWENKPEIDLLTLYFNATEKLPKNGIRTLVSNANNSLKSMAGADKNILKCNKCIVLVLSSIIKPK